MTKRIVAFELGTNDGQGGFKELLSVDFYTVGETETLSQARDRFIKIDREVYRGYTAGDDPSPSSVINKFVVRNKKFAAYNTYIGLVFLCPEDSQFYTEIASFDAPFITSEDCVEYLLEKNEHIADFLWDYVLGPMDPMTEGK